MGRIELLTEEREKELQELHEMLNLLTGDERLYLSFLIEQKQILDNFTGKIDINRKHISSEGRK